MTSDRRPSVASEIKRAVRQRCGFGCVMCGVPVYDYEHIYGWAATERHDVNEITLLCPNHHAEKTRGRLPVEIVENANRRPFNFNGDFTSTHKLNFVGKRCFVEIGSNVFSYYFRDEHNRIDALVINGRSLFSFEFENDGLLLNILVRDKSGIDTLLIRNSELIVSTKVWDFEFVGKHLLIRDSNKRQSLRIRLGVPDHIVVEQGLFHYQNRTVEVSPNAVTVDTNTVSGGRGYDIRCGIVVGPDFERYALSCVGFS